MNARLSSFTSTRTLSKPAARSSPCTVSTLAAPATHPVSALCRRYGVTRAGFYSWRRRGESQHAEQDRALLTEITRMFYGHHER